MERDWSRVFGCSVATGKLAIAMGLPFVVGLFFLGCSNPDSDSPSPSSSEFVAIEFSGDYLELERLMAEIPAELVKLEKGRLYLQVSPGQKVKLQAHGYQPITEDEDEILDVFVSIDQPTAQTTERVNAQGGQLIQRGPKSVVYRLTRKQRATLEKEGLGFREPREKEVIPRLVVITGDVADDTTLIGLIGVDVFEASDESVLARAFDFQIDELRKKGFTVELNDGQQPESD